MNAIVKSPFAWLLKREYWEERRGFLWAQIWAALVLVVLSVFGIIAFEVFRIRNGIRIGANGNLGDLLQHGMEHNAPALVNGLDGLMLVFGGIAAIVLFFVVFFYLLGALYEDRRDRSILFWKSLPISDTGTVLAKIVAAAVIAPVIAVLVTLAGYLALLVVVSLWFLAHGLNPIMLVWAHVDPFATWLHLLAIIPVNAVWALPTIGWLLLWSAAVRSKPFLWAVVTPILAGVLNFWVGMLGLPHISYTFFLDNLFSRALLGVVPGSWMMVANEHPVGAIADLASADRHIGTLGMAYHMFLTPQLWIGAAVGIALIAGAIWFRRWRDEA